MRCPQCKNKVIQKAGDMTRLRTHGPIEFDKDGTCRTKCHWCKTDVVLPISIRPGTQIEAERYYVRK